MKSLRAPLRGLAALVLLAAMNARAQSGPALPDNGIARIVAMRQQSLVDTHDFIDRRAAFEKLMAGLPAPDGVTIRTVSANGVPAKWIAPNSGDAHHRSVILYLHGGGFYSGSSDSHRMLAATLAKDAQADVLLIDYRRMPEAVYPAQIDDAVASYEWLLEQGYPASNIALAGESAGGNLVLELVLRLRDAHRPLPSSMVAMSPIMDLSASGDSTLAYGPVWFTSGSYFRPSCLMRAARSRTVARSFRRIWRIPEPHRDHRQHHDFNWGCQGASSGTGLRLAGYRDLGRLSRRLPLRCRRRPAGN
jgi:monoterpene epsilon-lactone hydrolase